MEDKYIEDLICYRKSATEPIYDICYPNLFDREKPIFISEFIPYYNEQNPEPNSSLVSVNDPLKHRRTINSMDELRSFINAVIDISFNILNDVLNREVEQSIRCPRVDICYLIEHTKFIIDTLKTLHSCQIPSDNCDTLFDKDFLANQIIMDLLLDKYLAESEMMTVYAYAKKTANEMYGENDDSYQKESFRNSIKYNATSGKKKYLELISQPEIQAELSQCGINSHKYQEFLDSKNLKLPEIMWKTFLWNKDNLIGKIYRRQLSRDEGNNTYWSIIEALQEYNKTVNKTFSTDNMSPEKYFKIAMEYYYHERYRQIDSSLTLANLFQKIGIVNIDSLNFLITRFIPQISTIWFNPSGTMGRLFKFRYYPPFWELNNMTLETLSEGHNEKDVLGASVYWYFFTILRAKTYELFKSHATLNLNNYIEIEEFLKNDFNVFQYREKNEAWERIMKLEKPKSSGPKRSAPLPDSSTQQFINNFIHIIEMLFPPSSKRNSSIGKRRAEKRAKEMEKRPNG